MSERLFYGGILLLIFQLIIRYPNTNLSTSLEDAHIYIFKKWVIDLITKNTRISSIRSDLLPLLAKMQWQSNLCKRAGIDQRTPFLFHENNVVLSEHPRQDIVDPSLVPVNLKVESPVSVALFLTSPSQYTLRVNSKPTYILLSQHLAPSHGSKTHPTAKLGNKASVSQDSYIGQNSILGDRVAVRKSVVGVNVTVGTRTTIKGSVIMDGVSIDANAKVEDCVLCRGAKVGAKVSLKKCFVGAGFQVEDETDIQGQNLVEFDDDDESAEEDDEDDEDE
jgi:translation initiation factor eIF-2B subunit gamma